MKKYILWLDQPGYPISVAFLTREEAESKAKEYADYNIKVTVLEIEVPT